MVATEARAQKASGYTAIDYYADTDTLDSYSETDMDDSLVGDYDAYVSLRITDPSGNILCANSARDNAGTGVISVGCSASGTTPNTTYTATGFHKPIANLWDYYSYYPYRPFYYDDYNFTSFEGEGIHEPWYFDFYSPGFQEIRRNTAPISVGSTYDSRSVSTPPCTRPVRESTTFGGWADSDGYPTVAKWNQTLLPNDKNFAGRYVTEASPPGALDTCYFTGSEVDEITAVDGATWPVESGNHWGPDANGWDAYSVNYYRSHGRARCGVTVPQQMLINCPTGTAAYATHILKLTIDTGTISSEHNGAFAVRAWP